MVDEQALFKRIRNKTASTEDMVYVSEKYGPMAAMNIAAGLDPTDKFADHYVFHSANKR